MKQTLRTIAGLLILCFFLSLMPTVQAAVAGPFSDVSVTAWYCAPVSYAQTVGISVGSGGNFRPNDPVTRAEFVTMLARVLMPDGFPEALPEVPFTDVPAGSYYAKPVAWAYANAIVFGTTETTFSPNGKIKRQDAAVMIYCAQQLPALGEMPYTVAEKPFADNKAISSYARAAVSALQQQELLAGDAMNCVNPKSSLTRAEAVTILSRIHMYKAGHAHNYLKAEVVPPTCKTKGIQCYRCSCGSYYGMKEFAALGHDYRQSGTDTSAWTVTYTCTRCGNSYTKPLPGEAPKKIYGGDSLITYAQALAVVDRLHEIYPSLITSYSGGTSYWGTSIRVVKLGKGSRYIFLNGNLHGTETITTNYLLKVLDEYAYAYATNGKIGGYQIKPLLDTFTLVIIPCCNPDGRARVLAGENVKTNGRGVDLNRNFPTNWKYVSSGLYGAYAGSEPETQTIIHVLNSYSFELALDCHTAGNVIYYADYDCSSALKTRSYNIANALKGGSGYPLYMYEASPGMANYARHPYGIPGLTIEMYPYTGSIDSSKFTVWVWSKLSTMPAIAMTYLK